MFVTFNESVPPPGNIKSRRPGDVEISGTWATTYERGYKIPEPLYYPRPPPRFFFFPVVKIRERREKTNNEIISTISLREFDEGRIFMDRGRGG